MGYRVDREIVTSLARMVELELPPERVALLAAELDDLMTLFARLDELDLTEVEPEVVFSAEWR